MHNAQRQAANLRRPITHYSPADYGGYFIEPHTLIGHEACDVMAWVADHPEYEGSIEYERWDFEGSVDVTEVFRPEDDDEINTNVERAAKC